MNVDVCEMAFGSRHALRKSTAGLFTALIWLWLIPPGFAYDLQLPPGPVIYSQVHNAPGWLPHHSYRYEQRPYTRAINGSGWDPATGKYNPGQQLYAYQLVTTGYCTSGGTGPQGEGQAISDGTCTWKYLSRVDYISITGWMYDAPLWRSGVQYKYFTAVTSGSPLTTYEQVNTHGCISTVEPDGQPTTATYSGVPGYREFMTSDGCAWAPIGVVIYSSERSHIPMQSGSPQRSQVNLSANYVAQIWNDREYVAGRNGEASPIMPAFHYTNWDDGTTFTNGGKPYRIVLSPAPGESFIDSYRPGERLFGIDSGKGVTVYDPNGYQWPNQPDAIDIRDYNVEVFGLQLDSLHGAAVGSLTTFTNAATVMNDILQGGSTDSWTEGNAASFDAWGFVSNSLIIATGPIGVSFKYPGMLVHDTIVNPSRTGGVAVETAATWVFNPTYVADTVIAGFVHAGGFGGAFGSKGPAFSDQSNYNITDAPHDDSGTYTLTTGSGSVNIPVYTIPGTDYGARTHELFVAFGENWNPGRLLRGAGSAIGNLPVTQPPSGRLPYLTDDDDLVQTPRPKNGRCDVGALQGAVVQPRLDR